MTISLIEIKNANYKEHSPITPIFSEAHKKIEAHRKILIQNPMH